MTAPLLTIAMSTMESRLGRIDFERLPVDPRWRYLVIVQRWGDAAAGIGAWAKAAMDARPDVSVLVSSESGVARSRNLAIEACETELLLFTDDDVQLIPSGLAWIISTFASDSALALLAGRTLGEPGNPARPYPARAQRLTRFNSARIGTVELAIRPRLVRERRVRFDPRYGAGARYRLGDEYVFVADCLAAGLRGLYGPVPIATHPGESSGLDFATTGVDRAMVFERVFPPALVLSVKLAFLFRHWKRFGSPASAWRFTREFLPFHES